MSGETAEMSVAAPGEKAKRYLTSAVRVAAVIVVLAAMVLLASCGRDPGDTADTTDTADTADNTGTADTSDTADTEGSFSLSRGEESDYVIVVGKNASTAEQEVAARLARAFEQYAGVKLKQTLDLDNEKLGYYERETEIVVGRTSRDMSGVWDADAHRLGDWFIGVSGRKLYIVGASDTALRNAADKFISKFLFGKVDSLELSAADNIDFAADYSLTSLTLNGRELRSASVAITGSNAYRKQVAVCFAESLTGAYGYGAWVSASGKADILLTTPDDTPAASALLGDCSAVLGALDGQAVLVGRTTGELFAAANRLCSLIGEGGRLALEDGAVAFEYKPDATIRVMSFNILGTTDIDKRRNAVAWVIAANMPDVFGIQEGKDEWLNFFGSNLGDTYACVGRGTNEAGYSNTYDNIYYRRDRFTAGESGTIWLSDTPETAGSKFSESKRVRIATYACLTDRVSGKTVLYVNTHLDNASSAARSKQADVLLKFISGYSCPAVVTGDFNSNASSAVYTKMTGVLRDARTDAAERHLAQTYNKLGEGTGSVIDHIFLSQGVKIGKYSVFTRLHEGVYYPSDHNAVVVEFEVG